ncbi:MAG: BamA/TamA family outer membrane protein [Acidobacteria bacterium]|nr:BamA/TamA family outer membrane protein [Acidobacteriota bacterium]
MKSSSTNGLRWILALALLTGGARARAQSAPGLAPNSAPNSHAFRTGSGARKDSSDAQQQSPAQPPAQRREPAVTVPPAPPKSAEPSGPIVTSVRIVDENGKVLAESPANISVQAGKLLERDQVADSIRTLYKTGTYSYIAARQDASDSGVRIDFVVREQLFFNQVVIRGVVAPPSDASAAAAMSLTLGTPYRKEAVEDGVARLTESLHDEGLYQAEVHVETIPHHDTHELDVIVTVKSGPRAKIQTIQLTNGTEYTNEEIIKLLSVRVGKPITSQRIQRGNERIHNFLVKKGHLSARASVRRGPYDKAANTIPLEVDITEGPRVQLVITGIKLSQGTLKKLVPIYQEGSVDVDLLEEGKRNIRERLERDGFFDASVEYTTVTRDAQPKGNWKGTEEIITYKVERGDRHKLAGVEISGNRYFNTDLLRSRLQIYGKGFATRGRFSRRLVESDRDSLLSLYQSNGFLDAKIDAQTLDNYKGVEGQLFVRYVIQEGKQSRVASLNIEGNHAFKEDELLPYVASTPGQPYSDYNVATDRDNILALYYNEGFPEARFTATATPVTPEPNATTDATKSATDKSPEPGVEAGDEMKVVYHIDEGPQTRVRRVLVTGYNHTRVGAIRREILVKPDAPLRQGDVIDSQRRLYNLGIFNRVTIEPQNPTGTDSNKDIVVLVEEAKRWTIAYGGGFEVQRLASSTNPTGSELQAAPRGILEISKLNVRGRGDSVSLKLRGSTIEDRALLTYTAPNTFSDPHYTFQANVYTEKTQDINTFTEERYEASVQLTDQATRFTTLQYRYAFRRVLVTNINNTVPPEDIPLFEQPTLVSQFGVTWARDARDNPADATKGSFNSFDFGIADTAIGSSASFLRMYYQNSTYHPLGRRFSFARAFRFGVLQPYKDTVSLAFPAQTTAVQLIPLPERFFAGGGTSLRGFALNQAGPRDLAGFPVGGQAVMEFHQEFRFPMRLPFVGSALGGALFYDGGNVYSRLSRITFRAYPPKPIFNPADPTVCQFNCTNELNYFAHTVGFGLRYSTPVGPIRVDLGFPINRPQFVSPICPNGNPLCLDGRNGFQATRLPGFQIFFNLGSTF